MPSSPETRLSLIGRLQTARDEAAWAEFLIVYEPLVLGLLRKDDQREQTDIDEAATGISAEDLEGLGEMTLTELTIRATEFQLR